MPDRAIKLPLLTVRDVAESQLCCGCGACAYAEPEAVRMVDDYENGRRPMIELHGAPSSGPQPGGGDAMRVCPGIALSHDVKNKDEIAALRAGWGPVLEVWEGYATDDAVRFAGSSGGVASAIAIGGIETGRIHGVLHIAARRDVPWLNETVLSTDRESILNATGSRYAPASPCDGLAMVEHAPAPCAIIGKPCDIAGANKAAAIRPELARKIGVTIAIFCAGTPSAKATTDLIRKTGVEKLEDVRSVRYRGNGWPGMWTVEAETDNGTHRAEMTYAESWDFLQRQRQWRCYVCADHTGEFADIAVGDPWYREIPDQEPGRSLVLVRTERGRAWIRAMMASGHLTLERADPAILPASQPNILHTRGSLWGRLLVLRCAGLPRPRFRGMPMFRYWLTAIGLRAKVQSTFGTLRRIARKRLRWRRPVEALDTRTLQQRNRTREHA